MTLCCDVQEFETLNLEIKELKTSIEAGHAQIQAAQKAIVQFTEQGGRLKEHVAEAKVNIYHIHPNIR
jgi:chromosome segregation ATPase